jgi:leucyl-tRNA synthetase
MVVHETYRRADGDWASPAEVDVDETGVERSARDKVTGEPVEIGPIEKMSKSKRNTVDPSDIISLYGADTARWFMLSDSPPERDVIWTAAGVDGAHRFVQRVWRMVREAVADESWPAAATTPNDLSERALALRRLAHRTLHIVGGHIAALRFNVAVAKIYELINAVAAVPTGDRAADAGLAAAHREALELAVEIMAPLVPHLAESCWEALDHHDMVATRPWPKADPALLVDELMILPVQVNGRKRGELSIAAGATDAEVEAAALALDAVRKALDGKPPRKVIVVPRRIVNVVV